jgi:hypothetical protein
MPMELRVPDLLKQLGFPTTRVKEDHSLDGGLRHTSMARAGHRPRTKWLVCNSVAEGCAVPSNLRECLCGTQVWVSALMTPLVDSSELRPRCWSCHHKTGHTVTLHDRTIDELTRLGRVDEGWQIIAEMNSHQSHPPQSPPAGQTPNHPLGSGGNVPDRLA